MTRHVRRSWRRTATHAVVATALAADATLTIVIALHTRNAVPLVTAVALAYASVIALIAAAVYAASTAWATARQAHLGRRSRRPAMTAEQIAEHRARADAEEQQHAKAMAAVEAEPMQPQTVAFTAVMPTVQTGVTWGFGPHGADVSEPQQLPWTPPVSEGTARHAGMPAELAQFDWEPSGALSP